VVQGNRPRKQTARIVEDEVRSKSSKKEVQLTPVRINENLVCAFSEQLDANVTGKREKYHCLPKGNQGIT
jgi:hypothetical protein